MDYEYCRTTNWSHTGKVTFGLWTSQIHMHAISSPRPWADWLSLDLIWTDRKIWIPYQTNGGNTVYLHCSWIQTVLTNIHAPNSTLTVFLGPFTDTVSLSYQTYRLLVEAEKKSGARKMPLWFRVLTAAAGDLSSVPSIHRVTHEFSGILSSPLASNNLCMHMVHIIPLRLMLTRIHISKI